MWTQCVLPDLQKSDPIFMTQSEWEKLSYAEKNRQLYFRQKALLDTFLEHHAISKEQYDKSLGDLTVKMGMENTEAAENSNSPS